MAINHLKLSNFEPIILAEGSRVFTVKFHHLLLLTPVFNAITVSQAYHKKSKKHAETLI